MTKLAARVLDLTVLHLGVTAILPVVRGCHAEDGKAGGPWAIRAVSPRDASPGAARERRSDR